MTQVQLHHGCSEKGSRPPRLTQARRVKAEQDALIRSGSRFSLPPEREVKVTISSGRIAIGRNRPPKSDALVVGVEIALVKILVRHNPSPVVKKYVAATVVSVTIRYLHEFPGPGQKSPQAGCRQISFHQ